MEHYLQQLNLTELMTKLDSFFPQLTLDTKKMWELILQGELKQVFWMVCESLAHTLTGQAAGMKNLMSSILILGILSVLVTSFLTGFENHQTAQVGYAVFYLLLLAVLFRIFFVCMQAAEEFLVLLGQFCRLTFPALCLSLSAAAGSLTAAGYYQIVLLLLTVLQTVLEKICLPALSAMMLLLFMNGIWEGDKLSSLTELIEKGVRVLLKTAVTSVTGLSVLQSMVAPVLDGLKRTAAQKTVAVIPGIGDMAEGTAQLLWGSAVLVKNSIGVFALVLILVLTVIPCIKLLLYGLLLKISGALIGIVADKRLTSCVTRTGEVIFLMLRICVTASGGFVILIAVVACLVGRN
ncbi:MAG: stage III sporulation protein AE [Lachnospiraceae bacterium]|nr:stage III sporulation protein AE [Lachnospiraceae bacterium]